MTFGISRGLAVDNAGNVQTNIYVEVRRVAPGYPLAAPIYVDAAGVSTLSNPFYSASGEFEFYAVGGAYRVRVYNAAGYDKTWDNVPVGTAQAIDVDRYAQAGFTWAPESATGTPPTSGCIRFNNADVSAATHVYLSKNTLGNSDVTKWLTAFQVGHWMLLSTGVGTEVGWPITAITNNTSWFDFTIDAANYAGPTGPISFGDSGFVSVSQQRPGQNGTNGSSALTVVRVAPTLNVTIASGLTSGNVRDGVTIANGDLVLLTGQTAPAENGVYVVGPTPTRLAAFSTYDAHPGCYFSVMEGTTNADTLWRCTSDKGGTINVTALAFSKFPALLAANNLSDLASAATARTNLGLGSSGQVLVDFVPFDNEPPSSNYATIDVRNGHPVLVFPDAVVYAAVFTAKMPARYSGGGVTVLIDWMSDGTSTNKVCFSAQLERVDVGTTDLDADSFGTQVIDTTGVAGNATSGIESQTSIALTAGGQMDSVVAGDRFRLKITRETGQANDANGGNIQVTGVTIKET
jgi:hypothetical protein